MEEKITPTSPPRPYPTCTPEPVQYRQVPVYKKRKEPNSDMYKEHDANMVTKILLIAFIICCIVAIYLLS